MKSALGPLLLRNNAIAPNALEKAQERQMVYGGTLDTALLETEALSEAVLLRFLPRANGAPLALPEELIDTDQVSLQLCSRDVAEKYMIVPLRVFAETMRVLVVDPVDMEALEALADELALSLEPLIVPEYRWQVAFAARFGTELAPRYVALAQTAKAQVAPNGLAAATDELLASTAYVAPTPVASLPEHMSRTRTGRNTKPGTGANVQRAVTRRNVTNAPADESADAGASGGASVTAAPGAATATTSAKLTPISVNEALRALGKVDDRDLIIEFVLRALRSRCEWAGLLTVRDKVASGRTALAAAGYDSKGLEYASVPLDIPSSLATAVQTRSPFSGPLATGYAAFDDQLGRFGGVVPASALFMPIVMRERVMAVFVAHRGHQEISAVDVLELLPLGPAAARAFERAIAKKRPSPRMSKQPRTVPIEPVALAEIAADAMAAQTAAAARPTHIHTVPSRTGNTAPPIPTANGNGNPELPGAITTSLRKPSQISGPTPTQGLANNARAVSYTSSPRSALSVEEAETFLAAIQDAAPREQKAEIATLGVAAASLTPHILRLFPGKLRGTRAEAPETEVRASVFGGLVSVLASMGPDAAEPIAQLLAHENRDFRFYAAVAAIDAAPADCIDLLTDRLFDQDQGVRIAATAALQVFPPRAIDVALMRVRQAIGHGDLEMIRAACDATARLGDAVAVADLIELFLKGQRHGELARSALIALTRHDLGTDGAAWRAWWTQNERRHRIEWLIDAIDRPDLPLRNAAALDLTKLATNYPTLAPPEGSFLYSPLAWKMWWATVSGQGSRVRIATAPPATSRTKTPA